MLYRIVLSSLIMAIAIGLQAQLLYNNDPDMTVENGAVLHVQGGVSVDISGYFHNAGTIDVEGDWINDTQISNGHTPNTGKVVLFGDAVQVIGGVTSTTFNDLVIQGNAHKILDIYTYVGGNAGALQLENQGLHLNANTLHITNPSNTAINYLIGSPTSYIESEDPAINDGKIMWEILNSTGNYVIPWGRSSESENIPFEFDVQVAGDATGNAVFSTHRVAADNTPYPQGDNVLNMNWNGVDNSENAVDRFWRVNLDAYTTKPEGILTFAWYGAGANVDETDQVPPAGAAAQLWDGLEWSFPYQATTGLISTAVTNQVSTVALQNTYNNWWTLSNSAKPLPIELLSFDGYKIDEKVRLAWTTATEINNDYFIVERSQDGSLFNGYVDSLGANGTSYTTKNYFTYDLEPHLGTNYYRLKQYDFDGTFSYSNIISVHFDTDEAFVNLSPVPATNNLNIEYSSTSSIDAVCNIYNEIGQLVISKVLETNAGVNNSNLDVKHLSEGFYFLSLQQGSKIKNLKFLIGKD